MGKEDKDRNRRGREVRGGEGKRREMDVALPVPRVGGGSMDLASAETSNNTSSHRLRVYQVWRGSNVSDLTAMLFYDKLIIAGTNCWVSWIL